MKNVVWGLVILLIIIHQDFWQWDNGTLVFGFMPIGLLYHAFLSVMAAGVWYLATVYAWPDDLAQIDAVSPENDASENKTAVKNTGGEA